MERDEALEILEGVLDASPADQTEAVLVENATALTRYANSAIHQNVASADATLVVRAVVGQRVGVAQTNRLDPASVHAAGERALRLAKAQEPNPDFVSLPEGGPPTKAENYASRTADATPEERAEIVRDVIARLEDRGVQAFGALETTTNALAVSNSLGAEAFDRGTVAQLIVSGIREEDGSRGYGRAEDLHVDLGKLDPARRAEEAAENALRSVHPRDLEAGTHPVVLADGATATLVIFLAYLTFNGLAYQEDRSAVSGKLGERVTGENVFLVDDATDPRGLPFGFDPEGVPKQRVSLLDGGVAQGVVHDSFTAGRADTTSTGHALVPPNSVGPIPLHPVLEAGDASVEEMVADTKRGIYVTRFHYTNAVDPAKALLTGMTRDGTFLIEDGELGPPVRNLRFTQGALEALDGISHLGAAPRAHRTSAWLGLGAAVVPALRLDSFRFTGTTEF